MPGSLVLHAPLTAPAAPTWLFDALFRTTKDTDVAGLSTLQEWDTYKDLLLSSTDPTGLKTTTIYDDDDRPVHSYGAAPQEWFGTDRKPITARVNDIPHTETKYDEGMVGPQVAWYGASSSTGSFSGAPKAHSTGLQPTDPALLHRSFAANPLPADYGAGTDYGFSATGKIRFPQTATYNLKALHDDGIRLWIDDRLVLDNWSHRSEATTQVASFGTFTAEANKAYRFKLDYIHFGTPGTMELWLTGPGIPVTHPTEQLGTSRPNFLSPAYNLTTSTTTHDSQLGNSTTTTNYGNRPELGLVQSTTENATGASGNGAGNDQNLTTSFTYEQPGSTEGYLRQTSKTLPGANAANASTAIQYLYYTATETRDNPCTPETDPISQAGMLKGKIEADPDGVGTETGRKTETVYDATGAPVATRINNGPWTCKVFDTRERTIQTTIPAHDGKPSRTISNNWAVGGNPLITSTTDEQGTITIENDLLGKTRKYTDANGNETLYTYDTFGDMLTKQSSLGTEEFTYDNLGRQTTHKLDGVVLAHISYDQYSRQSSVAYPDAGNLALGAIGRDSLQRISSLSYVTASQNISDSVSRSVGGDVLSGTENGIAKSYAYDGGNRLVSATIGADVFTYGFDISSSSTCNQQAANLNAGRNGNRTSMTINGAATTYCYDQADRLISTSDPRTTSAQYDAHGNTTRLGTDGLHTEFSYDVSDRNIRIYQADTGRTTTYSRDSQNRIKFRHTEQNGTTAGDSWYGFTGSGDTPDFVKNASGQIVEKYLELPGGTTITIRPDAPDAADKKMYSLPNIHGDIFATVSAMGTLISTHLTGPFGEQLSGQIAPTNTMAGTAYSYVGQHEKLTESDLALQPIQMGARVYIATLGRFLQVDPQEGGTDNNYAYANDPVNEFDLDGNRINWRKIGKAAVIAASVAGAVACGASVVCGVAVGAAAGAASYAVAKGGTKQFSVKGLAGSALKGGALGGGALAGRVLTTATKLKPLGQGGYVRIPGGGRSINQINQDIQRGVAPRSMIRADKGKIFGEQNHIHFKGGHALNMNGTFKHGGRVLTNIEKKYIKKIGWRLPRR